MSEDVSRDVDQLLKDRERYESWLERLESQRAGTSARAFERVRGDYQQRLEDVLRRLQGHSESINAKLADLGQQVAALEKERTGRAEELDEARLRRAVGEYGDDSDWRGLEKRLLGALQETEAGIERLRGEIGRLREIVAVVERPVEKPAARERPPEKPAKPEREAEPAVLAEERPVTSTLPPEVIEVAEEEPFEFAAEPPPVEPPAPEPVGETAPRFVPKPGPKRMEERRPPRPPEPEIAGIGSGADADEGYLSLGELVLEDSDLDDVLGEPARAQREAPPEPEPAPESEAEEGAEVGDELAFLESLSLGADEESEGFSFLAQRGSGTPQTIICPHCSAANDPAEWYCTECGEELPAE
jgi:hypothetical protein